jgi:hypothetical protein
MTLEQRLERLERQNRWTRVTAAVALSALALVVLSGQGAERPRTIEAEKFVVRDGDGKVVGELSSIGLRVAGPMEARKFVVKDQNGTRRAELGVWENERSELRLFGSDGTSGPELVDR